MNSTIFHPARRDRTSAQAAGAPQDQSGQILLMTALMLPVLLGFAALAIDAGFAFEVRKRLQTTADSAAVAGALAVDYEAGISQSALEAIARADAAQNGFQHGASGVTFAVIRSPGTADGFENDYTGDATAVGVVITQPTGMFLVRALSAMFASLTIRAQAVASQAADGNTNVVVFGKDDLGADTLGIDAQGSGSILVSGNVHVNSSFSRAARAEGGSSSISASSGRVYVTGGYSGNISPVTAGVPPIPDPLRNLPVPAIPMTVGHCAGSICTPGRYDNGLNPNHQALQPGLYYVLRGSAADAVSFRGHVTGSGVTIYVADDSWRIKGEGSATLSAPTTGTYAGILIFQRRDNVTSAEVRQGAITFTGAVYMKSANLLFSSGGGTGTTAPYSIFVVNTLQLHGSSTVLDNDFSSLPGGSPLRRVSLAE